MTQAKIPDDLGIGILGCVTASATAAHYRRGESVISYLSFFGKKRVKCPDVESNWSKWSTRDETESKRNSNGG
jgi:hypothetical protein